MKETLKAKECFYFILHECFGHFLSSKPLCIKNTPTKIVGYQICIFTLIKIIGNITNVSCSLDEVSFCTSKLLSNINPAKVIVEYKKFTFTLLLNMCFHNGYLNNTYHQIEKDVPAENYRYRYYESLKTYLIKY